MAVYPCSIRPHRYPQRQRSLYISDVSSARPETRKHRACPTHFDELVDYLGNHFTYIEDDSQMAILCEMCGAPRACSIFVKCYGEDHEEPAQYAVDLCAACRVQVLQDLAWAQGLPVGS